MFGSIGGPQGTADRVPPRMADLFGQTTMPRMQKSAGVMDGADLLFSAQRGGMGGGGAFGGGGGRSRKLQRHDTDAAQQ